MPDSVREQIRAKSGLANKGKHRSPQSEFKKGMKLMGIPIRRGQHLSASTEFKKGHQTWNKGKRGWRAASEAERLIRSQNMKKRWRDGFTGTTGMRFPEHSALMRQRWKMPEYRERTVRLTLRSLFRRPTSLERNFRCILLKHGLPFKYCGDGRIIIGGKNPDFIHNQGKRIVLEVGNNFHHSPDYARERINFFKMYDYKCAVFYADSKGLLDGEENVVSRIKALL